MNENDKTIASLPWLREAAELCRSGSPLDMTAEPAGYRASAFLDRHLHIGIPWCGVFVAHCLRKTLPGIPVPRYHMRARPWSSWGHASAPRPGAVFWHYFRGSPFGHVGFYWAGEADSIQILSGNRRDRISITRYPRDRIVACRWPVGAEEPGY